MIFETVSSVGLEPRGLITNIWENDKKDIEMIHTPNKRNKIIIIIYKLYVYIYIYTLILCKKKSKII